MPDKGRLGIIWARQNQAIRNLQAGWHMEGLFVNEAEIIYLKDVAASLRETPELWSQGTHWGGVTRGGGQVSEGAWPWAVLQLGFLLWISIIFVWG